VAYPELYKRVCKEKERNSEQLRGLGPVWNSKRVQVTQNVISEGL